MELTLFIIVGAVAVISAAMMLVSENAVHSALFLIMNFLCIAFFFLMLNAAFLALVQITVYAGAIMVLFLFVIMLLGAERLMPEIQPNFPWLAPAAVGLALLFLLVTSLVIIRGDIKLNLPKNDQPSLRVVNVMDGAEAIDVYLNEDRVAENLAFGSHTDYADRAQGESHLTVFRAGDDPETDTPLLDQVISLNAGHTFTLVAAGTLSAPRMLSVEENAASVSNKDKLRVMVVNAIQGVSRIDIARGEDRDNLLIDNVDYGEISEFEALIEGEYNITVYRDDEMRTRWQTFKDRELEADTAWLWVFASQHQPDNSVAERMIPLEMSLAPSFGGPAHVGQLLFNRYVLPFEMVSLLLLAAMIGAIVLTHEPSQPKRVNVRRLANPPAGLEKPITEKKRD